MLTPYLGQRVIAASLLCGAFAAMAFCTAYCLVARNRDNDGKTQSYANDSMTRLDAEDQLSQFDAQVSALAKQPADVLVAMLLEDAAPWGLPHRVIEEAGPRVVPALLDAVSDPRYRGGDQRERVTGELLEPLEGVLSCLAEYAPREAVPVVTPLAQDERARIRQKVALLLGSIGTEEAANPVCTLLMDEENSVCSFAMLGILRAAEAGRVEAAFSRIVFEAIKPLAFQQEYAFRRAGHCLLALNRERASAFLTSSDNLKSDRDGLVHALRALRESRVSVPQECLLAILSHLEARATAYPAEYIVGEVLQLLAFTKSEAAVTAITRCSEHGSRHVRECAAVAKATIMGLDDPLREIKDKYFSVGWENMSAMEKHTFAVDMLVNEVKNGGFLQYFVNYSANHWREAAIGLTEIGASGDRELLDRVAELFGPGGPSIDQQQRREQLASITDIDQQPFAVMEEEFFEDKQDREVLLLEYVMRHYDDRPSRSQGIAKQGQNGGSETGQDAERKDEGAE